MIRGAKSSRTTERKSLSDLVAGARRAEESFIKQELSRHKTTEVRLRTKPGSQRAKAMDATLAFRSGQRYMRMEWSILRGEATFRGRGGDTLMKFEEFGRDFDSGKEDASSIEEVHSIETNEDGRGTNFAKARENTRVAFGIGFAQELQSDVPGIG
jgi:hypothetical protein